MVLLALMLQMQKAMLLELVYPTVSALPPVLPEARRMPKLFWFDTGLVNSVGKVRKDIIGSENAISHLRSLHSFMDITMDNLFELQVTQVL